jgi:predicted RNase H-like nuclease (RuvC/YqgF family)
MAESSDIPVADNFQPVPGVDYGEVETPVTPEVTPAPETTVIPEETVQPETPVEPAKPEAVVEEKPLRQKAKPIASLLEKKHELETQLSERDARIAELEAQLQKPSVHSDDDIKGLAEEYGLDETLVSRLVQTARNGINPELPPEVQSLIQEREMEKQQQAELAEFNTRVDSLAKTLPNESFTDPAVQQKLLNLAYSTELAPDGEPYYKKELSELYFAYIKPEIEPGKVSAETGQGGTQASGVVDFEEIFNRDNPKDIENMDSDTFNKYNAWVKEHKESKTPLRRV